jgi:hypothetical protein
MPIIDVYLWAILGAGLWIGRRAPERRRTAALVALAMMLGDYGLRGIAHEQAMARAPDALGPIVARRCDGGPIDSRVVATWPLEGVSPPGLHDQSPCLLDVAALPDFLSPVQWRIIGQTRDSYEIREVNLMAPRSTARGDIGASRAHAVRISNDWTPAVFGAASAEPARVLLGFSRFPAARSIVDADGTAIVEWRDVRFLGFLGSDGDGAVSAFGATVHLNRHGEILESALGTRRR